MKVRKQLMGVGILGLFLYTPCLLKADIKGETATLKKIYVTGQIKFAQELKITRDSFPGNVDTKLIVSYCLYKNNIYMADLLCNIKIVSTSGKFIKSFSQKGAGPGDLYLPYQMNFSGDNLVVWETGNQRFSIFDDQGNLKKIAKPKYKGRVVEINTLDDGSMIIEREAVAWVKNDLVQLFGLELFSKDFTFVKDLYQKEISRYIPIKDYSSHRRLIRPFCTDFCWDVLPGNRMVIGNSADYKIEIASIKNGAKKYFSHPYSPIKVTEADKKRFFDGMVSSNSFNNPTIGADRFTREHTVFPEYKPAFKKIFVDSEGNILIFTYEKRTDGDSRYRAGSFDAFDGDGNFINHVKIVSAREIFIYKIISTADNIFWTLDEDSEGDWAIIKYKVMK